MFNIMFHAWTCNGIRYKIGKDFNIHVNWIAEAVLNCVYIDIVTESTEFREELAYDSTL